MSPLTLYPDSAVIMHPLLLPRILWHQWAKNQCGVIDAVSAHHLCFAQFLTADADSTGFNLLFGYDRAFVGLGVRAARDAVAAERLLHRGEVGLEPIEVDTQRGRVEIPLRDPYLASGVNGDRARSR